jgi:hypothetical protein
VQIHSMTVPYGLYLSFDKLYFLKRKSVGKNIPEITAKTS